MTHHTWTTYDRVSREWGWWCWSCRTRVAFYTTIGEMLRERENHEGSV